MNAKELTGGAETDSQSPKRRGSPDRSQADQLKDYQKRVDKMKQKF